MRTVRSPNGAPCVSEVLEKPFGRASTYRNHEDAGSAGQILVISEHRAVGRKLRVMASLGNLPSFSADGRDHVNTGRRLNMVTKRDGAAVRRECRLHLIPGE